jgi:hypothetical protein
MGRAPAPAYHRRIVHAPLAAMPRPFDCIVLLAMLLLRRCTAWLRDGRVRTGAIAAVVILVPGAWIAWLAWQAVRRVRTAAAPDA